MKTNKERYEEYASKIDRMKSDFAKSSNFENPGKLYIPSPKGTVIEQTITKIDVIVPFHIKRKKRYTGRDVDKIREFWEELPSILEEKGISLFYTTKYKTYTASGAHRENDYKEKIKKGSLFLSRDEAQKKADELLDIYGEKPGHINCAYCGKAVPENKAVDYTIIYQGWNGHQTAVMRKTNKYCPGNCGSHDQMGHEG